jgi:hypothetical protein
VTVTITAEDENALVARMQSVVRRLGHHDDHRTGAPNVGRCRGVLDAARGFSLSFSLDWLDVADELRANLRAVGVLDAAGVTMYTFTGEQLVADVYAQNVGARLSEVTT